MSTSDPYIQVNKVVVELRVYGIDAKRGIRAGIHDIYVNGEWFTVHASEPRISTGRTPIRAIDLYGIGIAAEKLLVLEARLAAVPGMFEIKNAAGDLIEVSTIRKNNTDSFNGLRALMYVFGIFLSDMEEKEFRCLFNIAGDNGILGVALEEHWRGERALVITDLTLEQKITLVRAIVKREFVMVEKIPWIR